MRLRCRLTPSLIAAAMTALTVLDVILMRGASASSSTTSNIPESSTEQLQGILRELEEQEQRYRSAYLRVTQELNSHEDQLIAVKRRVVEAQLDREYEEEEEKCVKHLVVVNGKLHVVCKPVFDQAAHERRGQKLLVPI